MPDLGLEREADMPTINVSQNVLRLIRTLRTAGEKTENETLERVLRGVASAREEALRQYEAAEQDIKSTN